MAEEKLKSTRVINAVIFRLRNQKLMETSSMSTSVQLKFLKKGKDLTEEQQFTVAEKLDYTACLVDTVDDYTQIPVFTGRIHPGGQSTLFVYEFPMTEDLSFVIKIYNPLKSTLERLVLHFLSVEEFYSRAGSLSVDRASIRIMPVFALGLMRLPTRTTPFLVQEFSEGIPISQCISNPNYRALLKILKSVFKEMARNDFIVDPLPTNWFVTNLEDIEAGNQDTVNMDYIDVLSSNRANSSEIKKSLKNFYGDDF